ncbi:MULTISPECIES: AAA family ATPase [Lactiplantibacillus]|nr:AAA family ATPase [Lactiplantibacillus plantarum]AUS72697.1 Stage V sporulation protein K [Lactiplantibacillus plantarum]KZU35032.1 putative RuBisCo-expression protein CbbX [Lactiplantibacillus plantarum]KZU76026.1 putative RuBisCo-expression protein CbbX [Lactiplantibacillus plantarum]MBC6381687.1 AAA family ATPase [Lactiplantibacillus plantarum]MCG0833001.1 Stage V sporulation protein K [Lactiplantibacillus plantarum]
MQRVIKIESGLDDYNLQDALDQNYDEAMLVLSPGVYQIKDSTVHKKLKLRGIGKNAKDVVIEGSLILAKNAEMDIENLMIKHAAIGNNLIHMEEGSRLTAKGVIFNNLDNVSSIYATHADLKLIACEVRQLNTDGRGIVANEKSNLLIDRSDIQYLKLSETKSLIKMSQIREALLVKNGSELNADTLYMTDLNSEYYALSGENHGQIKIDNLQLSRGKIQANLSSSIMKVITDNIDDRHQLVVKTDKAENVAVPGSKIILNNNFNNATLVNFSTGEKHLKSHNNQGTVINRLVDHVSAIDQINAMVGLTSVKQGINQLIALTKFNQKREEQGLSQITQSLHSVFYGNPGTGKTTVARLVAQAMYEEGVMPNNTYMEVARQDLVAQYVGGTAIKTEEVLEKAVGGVLFIDEAYSLYQADSSSNWGQEAVDTILKFMEDHRNDLMIIFAGYPKEMQDFINMNPGLESRIANQFNFEDYTPEEVAEIGVRSLNQKEFQFDEMCYRKAISKAYQGDISNSNGRWVRNFNDKLLKIVAMHAMTDANRDAVTILNSDIEELAGGNKIGKEVMVKKLLAQLDDMIGLNNVKVFVHNLVKQVVVGQKLGDQLGEDSQPTYHMIFSGNPGTGKTTVARIIGQLLFNLDVLPKSTVSEVSRTDLVGAYVGQTEEKTSRVVRNAMGGVLFIDEAYQLTSTGQDSNDYGHQAVETLIPVLENERNKFVAIFAGYTNEMVSFLNVNPGLRSRIPLHVEFADYSSLEVAKIVAKTVEKDFQVNDELLKQVVVDHYDDLPVSERANGRWARNFSDKLIMNHKLWLNDHLNQVTNVKQIDDSVLNDSLQWPV